jgi:hypothetical protein
MWIFSKDAFLSVVQVKDNLDRLLVRSRVKGDIEKVFSSVKVVESAGTDYRFRAVVEREAVANVMKSMVNDIDYTNFKDQIKDHQRHWAYMDVWVDMVRMQDTMEYIENASANKKRGRQETLPGLGRSTKRGARKRKPVHR